MNKIKRLKILQKIGDVIQTRRCYESGVLFINDTIAFILLTSVTWDFKA